MSDIFGVSDIVKAAHDLIDRIIPDPKIAADAKLKTVELAQNGDLEGLRIAMADTANARNREIENNKSGKTERITPALAVFITIGFFGLLGAAFFIPIQASMEQVANILIGTLAAAWGQVVGYYFGSSHSSKAKDILIANQGETNHVNKQSIPTNGK